MNKLLFPSSSRGQAACPKAFCAGVLLVFAGLHEAALAQAASAPSRSKDDLVAPEAGDKPPQRNGYAENLIPKIKRAASTSNQPYAPIKKQDDQSQIPEIEMFVGESRVFPTPRVARIAVGNGQIMNAAALDNREVIVFANGVGTSSLFIWSEDGRYQRVKVNIAPGDTSRYSREIAAFLTAIPNAKASVIGDKIIVEGDNLSDLDLAKIEELNKRYPQIVNFTNRLGWEQMVIMDVKVVEFPVNELRDIGLKWNAAGGATVGAIWSPVRRGDNSNYAIGLPTAGGSVAPPITGSDGSASTLPLPSGLHVMSLLNLGLNAQLNLLAQNGSASILAEPQLSARNGAKASFLAGGEYPYVVTTNNGPTVMFKPYGVKLDIVPKVDRSGVIRAEITSEVSAIDTSITTLAGPALSTRKTSTEFNVRSGETLVLSGLLSRKMSTTIDKVPLLGDIPVIGALFRSKRFQNDETELVVFVTPNVIDSRSAGLVDRIEKTKTRLEQELGKQPYLDDPLQPGRGASQVDETRPRTPPTPASESSPVAPSLADSVAPPSLTDDGAALHVVRDGVVLRAAASNAATALVELPRGATVRMMPTELEHRGGVAWRNVRVGELQGWVADLALVPARLEAGLSPSRSAVRNEQGVSQVQAVTANAGPVAAPLARLRVMQARLALRASPDINAPAVARLRDGDVIEALPQPPSGYWVAVRSDGKRGWVPAQWLTPVP